MMLRLLCFSSMRYSHPAQTPDVILQHAKVVTVDPQIPYRASDRMRGDRIVAVGSNSEVLKHKDPTLGSSTFRW